MLHTHTATQKFKLSEAQNWFSFAVNYCTDVRLRVMCKGKMCDVMLRHLKVAHAHIHPKPEIMWSAKKKGFTFAVNYTDVRLYVTCMQDCKCQVCVWIHCYVNYHVILLSVSLSLSVIKMWGFSKGGHVFVFVKLGWFLGEHKLIYWR